ncbi:hypothetical protein [Sorangium sp. So ce131]|uniref:hypothetical protein n=1 Tax=Sorangium sp. So ce131 TaxID=3133282 RepID=UPI003F5D9786
MPLCVVCGNKLGCTRADQHLGQSGVEQPCALKKGALWVHVMDDAGEAVKGVVVDVSGSQKTTEDNGFARFDPMEAQKYTAKLPDKLPDAYDAPEATSSDVWLSQGEVAYLGFSLPRKPKLKVKVVKKGEATKLFGDATVTITGVNKRATANAKTAGDTGLADLKTQAADEYTIEVALKSDDEKDFFVPAIPNVKLEAGEDRVLTVEVEPVNVVTPKIEVEYKVVLLDRKLAAHKVGSEDPIYADLTRIEVSFSETNAEHPHETGAKVELDPPDGAEVYLDAKCTTKLTADLTKDDLPKGKAKELYLRGAKAGALKVTFTLKDPEPADKQKIRLDKNPAESPMAVIALELEAYSAKKAHSKVFADDDAPTHTKLTDEGKVKKGRILVVQDGGKHGRAKVVVKKPDDALWTTGAADYEVILAQKATSGSLKLYDAETGGTLKQDLSSGPLKLKKADLTGDATYWVEGAAASDDLRQTWLHLGLDRPVGGLAKAEKTLGDVARFTVVELAWVKPDTADYKQYVNLAADVSHPEHGRELKAKAKLSKALKDVELMFSLVPDAGNEADIPDKSKHDKPKDTDAAVKTDDKGEVESSALKLSIRGGHKFKVAVYPLEAPPPKKLVPDKSVSKDIEIWRELFYTVVCMKRYDGTDYSDRLDEAGVASTFGAAFIKMTRKGGVVIKPFTSVVKDSQIGTWHGNNFGGNLPLTLNIGLIEAQTGDATQDVDRSWDANADWNGVAKTSTETLSGFTFDLSDPAEWLDSAYYQNTDLGGWTQLAADKVKLVLDGLDHKLKVDLSTIVTGGVTVDKIKLKATLKALDEWSGDKTNHGILIGMRWREQSYPGQVDDSARQTTLHETGHFLGLAPTTRGNNAQDANNRWYFQTGNHCSYNTDGCVMYDAFKFVFDFCDHCTGSLLSRDFTSPPVDAAAAY